MLSNTQILLIAGGIGLVVGVVVSVVFGIYSKPTANSYIRSFFGMPSSEFITTMIVWILAAGVIGLAGISAVVKDIAYPVAKPLEFTTETILFSFLPASVFLLMSYFRGYPIDGDKIMEFMLLAVKFGLLHILMQFSGFYSNVFPPK